MNDWEEDLRVLMRGGDEAPVSRVDLGRVVTDGRRRRRWRAVGAGGAAAVAVLALLAGAAAAVPQQTPQSGAAGPSPVPVTRFRPGWLPPGVEPGPSPSPLAARQSRQYRDTAGTTDFTVTIYAPGDVPHPGGDPEPAEDLGGRPALWYTDRAHPERSGLLWEWAPDAYATVEGIAPGSAAQDRAVWRHVAERLELIG